VFLERGDEKFGLHFKLGRTSPHGSYILFMNDSEPVINALKNSSVFQVDGTFRISPRLFYQILWIFMVVSDVLMPFACIWLTGKSHDLYSIAFTDLKQFLPEVTPSSIMSDWEIALQTSFKVKKLFPISNNSCIKLYYYSF
jgi:hypothetical protein